MKVEFTLTSKDCAAMYEHVRIPPGTLRGFSGFVCLLLLLPSAGLVAEGVAWPIVAGVYLLLAVLVFVSSPFVVRLISKGLVAQVAHDLRASMSLEVRPEGLAQTMETKTETTASLVIWEAIDRIVLSDTHVFFYGDKGVLQILPRRAFADERDLGEFVESARNYQEAAKLSEAALRGGSGASHSCYPTNRARGVPMKCPKCSEEMVQGAIAVHGTFLGFLFAGWSIQHCWWQPGGDYMSGVEIVPSGGKREAFRCEKCRMLIVPDV